VVADQIVHKIPLSLERQDEQQLKNLTGGQIKTHEQENCSALSGKSSSGKLAGGGGIEAWARLGALLPRDG
jgi:hypothetical protein